MPDFVIFTLVAPMGSFGDLAGHEWRGSTGWPGRSAILGLIGAALGVRRDDGAGQAGLDAWRMAVSVLSPGAALRDFPTVQTVPAARIKRPRTRGDALAALNRSDNGLITRRDYRMDCAFGVALWGGEAAETLVSALSEPVFTPYLGRKCCPLSAPMAPAMVAAFGPSQALAQITLPPFLALDPARPLFVASDQAPESSREHEQGGHVETRWDQPLDRGKWHFGSREVHIYKPDGEGAP